MSSCRWPEGCSADVDLGAELCYWHGKLADGLTLPDPDAWRSRDKQRRRDEQILERARRAYPEEAS